MTGRYQAYPEYKNSEVDWIGKYPSSWNITRVKFESYVKARVGWHGLKSDDFTDEGPYLVTGSDFRGSNIKWEDCYHCDLERYDQDPYIQLQEGDLLITKDGTIGKVALVNNLLGRATLNSGVFVVRPLGQNYTSRFYFWLLQSSVFTGFVDFNKTGSTIVHLYQDTFVNFKYAMPAYSEQLVINNFLDHETAKIDTLIEKQQQLIQLLKEKRQAVISHAVTKGLNPDVPMRDSGVEWLGEVPEHWDVARLKHLLTNIKAGPFGSSLTKDMYVKSGYRVYGQEQVIPDDFNLGDYYISEEKYQELKQYQIATDDILISCVGTFGKIAIVPPDIELGVINPRLIRLRCATSVTPSYLVTLLRSMVVFEQFSLLSRGGTMDVINIGTLNEIILPVPEISEQDVILQFVYNETTKLDILINKASSAIELMQERRTALISAAVTGKIDVRNWQPPQTNTTEAS
ncbi:restriction endonuclease subunit S [Methylomonas sp. AM2-LC]|uniref:restriction endonuclease subunit S n=1 Tax=Methylomonas sp. AM2-LC TaxID=3153301 RepID=UPI003265B8C7